MVLSTVCLEVSIIRNRFFESPTSHCIRKSAKSVVHCFRGRSSSSNSPGSSTNQCSLESSTAFFSSVHAQKMHLRRIQHYCKIHRGEHWQNRNIKLRHSDLLMISSENFAAPLYTPLKWWSWLQTGQFLGLCDSLVKEMVLVVGKFLKQCQDYVSTPEGSESEVDWAASRGGGQRLCVGRCWGSYPAFWCGSFSTTLERSTQLRRRLLPVWECETFWSKHPR